ncbi:hypothetical protein NQ318_008810 [Aromia moschata]|uniref:Uncharacterized protein n=1 Tax=Aromia moschata TaxID=1265417 RepID=A0AAV8ZD83_9CUCU|nr:hypothetical protein NQ318_008810 [Aromia moschata]
MFFSLVVSVPPKLDSDGYIIGGSNNNILNHSYDQHFAKGFFLSLFHEDFLLNHQTPLAASAKTKRVSSSRRGKCGRDAAVGEKTQGPFGTTVIISTMK